MRRGIIYTTLFVLILISVTKSAFINQFADVKKFFQSLGDESAEKKLSDEVQVISDKLDKKDLKLKQNKAYTTVGAGVKDFVVGIKSGDPYQITSGVLKIASGITAFLAVPIVPQILNLLAIAIAAMKPKDVRDPLKTALQEFGTEQIRKELQGKLKFVIKKIGETTESMKQRRKYLTELENIKYKFDEALNTACSDKTRNEECLKLVDAFVAFRSAYCLLVFASYEDPDKVKQKLDQTFDEDYISFEFLINLVQAGPNNKIFSAVMRTPGQYKNIQFFIRNLMGHFDADNSKSQFFKTIYLCDDLTATLCSAIGDRANEKAFQGNEKSGKIYEFASKVHKKAIFVPYDKEVYISETKLANPTLTQMKGPYRGMALYSSKKKFEFIQIAYLPIEEHEETFHCIRICTAHNWCDNVLPRGISYQTNEVIQLNNIHKVDITKSKLQSIWVPDNIKIKLQSIKASHSITIVGPYFVNNLQMCAKYWKSVTILSNDVDSTDEGNLVQYCSKPNLAGICLQSIPDERKNGVDTHMVYEGKFFRKCKYDIASILVPQPIELLLCFGDSKSRRLLGYGVEDNLKDIQGGFFSHFKTRAVLFKTKLKNSEVPMSCQISTELQQHEENLAKEVEENKIDEVDKDDHETEEVKERLPDENSNDGEVDDDSDNDSRQGANDSIKAKLGMQSVTE